MNDIHARIDARANEEMMRIYDRAFAAEMKRISRIYLLNIAGFVFIFAYFAFNLDDGPNSCLAFTTEKEDNEHALDGKPQHGSYTDVGATMRGWFGSLAILFSFLGSFYLVIVLGGDVKRYSSIIMGISNPIGFLHLVCWIFLFICRYSFAGEVCSGAYLTAEDYEKDEDIERKYLIDMGLFIQFVWWFWFIIFLLAVVAFTVLICVK